MTVSRSQPKGESLSERLLAMPSSLNDACRTMEEAHGEIQRLQQALEAQEQAWREREAIGNESGQALVDSLKARAAVEAAINAVAATTPEENRVLCAEISRLRKENSDLAARITNVAQAPTSPDVVIVPRSALEWLLGAAPDHEGMWFGESVEQTTRKYGFRSRFRKMCEALGYPIPSTDRPFDPAEWEKIIEDRQEAVAQSSPQGDGQ